SQSEWRDYAKYCCDDTEGTYHLFHWLLARLPREELSVIDMTLRMYLEPQLIADAPTFQGVLDAERKAKADLLAKLPDDMVRADLMSNQKFAAALEKLGVEPPMKISPTTGKPTYAFSKNDPEWKDLEDEMMDDPIIAPILAARVGAKSTLAESRAERLLEIAKRHKYFRVPLIYYSAHTGRYGGTEKINAQNFTRVKYDKAGNPTTRHQLRFGLQAPKHHSVMAPDLAQIEARINAWLSGCDKLTTLFANGQDVYSAFATRLFSRSITKADKTERFIGKTCILGLGYGMGGPKLKATLRKDNLVVNDAEADRYVHTYRDEYYEIPAMWRFCDQAIDVIRNGGKMRIGPCIAEKGKIVLPNGMTLDYPNLKFIQTPKYEGWTYTYAGRTRTLWGGKVVEN
ncbi:MAG: DNA polymerase, partial [Afipia sp.]